MLQTDCLEINYEYGSVAHLLGEIGESLLGMLGPEVEQVDPGLQGRGDELVHGDVAPVELEAADAVLEVALPPQGHGAQVEHLEVAVVVARHDHAVHVAVRVAEGHGPAVAARVALGRLHRRHRSVLLAGVPYLRVRVEGKYGRNIVVWKIFLKQFLSGSFRMKPWEFTGIH